MEEQRTNDRRNTEKCINFWDAKIHPITGRVELPRDKENQVIKTKQETKWTSYLNIA